MLSISESSSVMFRKPQDHTGGSLDSCLDDARYLCDGNCNFGRKLFFGRKLQNVLDAYSLYRSLYRSRYSLYRSLVSRDPKLPCVLL